MRDIAIGIIGGGLMGKEMASAFARWCALDGQSCKPVLSAVCDVNPTALEWFDRIPSVEQKTTDLEAFLDNDSIEVVYAAVPHNLHQSVYLRVLESGKDLFAEKPFGMDLDAGNAVVASAGKHNRFVRCSSEFPYFPAARQAYRIIEETDFGRVLEARFAFHHSSDLDATKPANWKRMQSTCGKIGVMGDLGIHTTHIPFRLNWRPVSVYAQLQNGYRQRPDGKGGSVNCDTHDNATLNAWVQTKDEPFPLRLEMKRMAPGETNTWFLEVLGTKAGVRYSTAEPKTLWTFATKGKQQYWERRYVGFETEFPAITGGIFEPGFPDIIQQMWAAFLEERNGTLGNRFGCVTPSEARDSHVLFEAALRSHNSQRLELIEY